MIVGITGGIGAGKTTVSKIFESFGIAVYDADDHSKNLLDLDLELKGELVHLLGSEILQDQKINRAAMANIIFNNEDLLKKANALIHPKVAEHFSHWISNQNTPYQIKEAAILFESGAYKACDKVITVSAPEEIRIQRVMNRSQISREEVLSRIAKQWPDEKKIGLADFVIINDGSHSLIKQSLEIHKKLLTH